MAYEERLRNPAMAQPVTLRKAASFMSGPASQEGGIILKGRVYLEKKSIGTLNRWAERASEPPAPQDESKSIIYSWKSQNIYALWYFRTEYV